MKEDVKQNHQGGWFVVSAPGDEGDYQLDIKFPNEIQHPEQ